MDRFNLSSEENFHILSLDGWEGHYLGVSLSVVSRPGAHGRWWEGDEMLFINGAAWPPVIHGTGTEDYFGLAYGFRKVLHRPQFGVVVLEPDENAASQVDGTFGMYRFHGELPIPFRRSLEVSIEHGHANESDALYRSVAYWYGREL